MAGYFPEKPSWRSVEQVCQGVNYSASVSAEDFLTYLTLVVCLFVDEPWYWHSIDNSVTLTVQSVPARKLTDTYDLCLTGEVRPSTS